MKKLAWLIAIWSSLVVAKVPETPKGPLQVNEQISTEDWRLFLAGSPGWKKDLWVKHTQKGLALKDWHWSWRVAWLRACRLWEEGWCNEMLKNGLKDKALVVRAEAAQGLGERFTGHGNAEARGCLGEAFRHPGNLRKGKPLYILQYILFALHKMGDPAAAKLGAELAAAYPSTRNYWGKLQNKVDLTAKPSI